MHDTPAHRARAGAAPELDSLFDKAILSLGKSSVARALVVDARDLNLFSPHVGAEPPLQAAQTITAPPATRHPNVNWAA